LSRADPIADAQDEAGHGRFLLSSFSFAGKEKEDSIGEKGTPDRLNLSWPSTKGGAFRSD
jgi:hypothetical protein